MRPSIVLFGDSITEESFGEGGWGAHLANHFSRSADVVLRGYNTRWAARVADRAAAAVTVFFGANDASLPDRTCPCRSTRTTSAPSAAPSRAVVILVTPPPIDEDALLRYPYGDDCSGLPERTNESAGANARACVEVAKQSGLRAIDLWSRMQKFAGWETSFLRDGLHLTPLGNRLLFEEVVFALKDAHLSLEALPADLPLFCDVDPNDGGKCFDE